MLVENQIVELSWNNANKKHYINKGYSFTKNGDKFIVDVNDLSHGSNHKVDVICDNCGCVKKVSYSDYLKCHKKHEIDLCKKCQNIAAQMTWTEKYGVSHPRKIKEIQDKAKETCIKKYGCSNPMQNQTIRQKAENTLLGKYGVKHPLQNDEIHEKANNACIEKYGVACVFKSDEIKNKIKEVNLSKYGVENPRQLDWVKEKAQQTSLEKYGTKYPMQNTDIKAKAMATLCNNGACPTSTQQLKVFDMLNELYGNAKLNYPIGTLSLDCVVDVNNTPIDVEYDGVYWHQDKQKDLRRNKVVIKLGYKVLRIRGNYAVPTKEQLKDAIDYLAYSDHHYKLIELDI